MTIIKPSEDMAELTREDTIDASTGRLNVTAAVTTFGNVATVTSNVDIGDGGGGGDLGGGIDGGSNDSGHSDGDDGVSDVTAIDDEKTISQTENIDDNKVNLSDASENFEMITSEGVKTGKCKWFNGTKGWGFITLDDGGQDVFVHQSILQMKGFRQLGESEEVEIEFKITDKGLEAVKVTGPNGEDCRGSKGPHQTRRIRKIRCYNCGEFKNHKASKCTQPPQPKRCHRCKNETHLVADCPDKPPKLPSTTSGGGGGGGGGGGSVGGDNTSTISAGTSEYTEKSMINDEFSRHTISSSPPAKPTSASSIIQSSNIPAMLPVERSTDVIVDAVSNIQLRE